MPIGPKGPPRKPGLSIRGRVIVSTFRGVPYTRPWPKPKPTKPGSPRAFTAKTFGAANRAAKITEATFYGAHWQATRGTPLLPRDLMMALMYGRAFALQLEDGRQIWSMAARADVSKSLDVLSNVQGSILIRGEKYWEARSTGGSTYKCATLYRSINGPTENYNTPKACTFDAVAQDIGGWTDIATHPTRLTVPTGVSRIRFTASVVFINYSSGSFALIQGAKNGATGGVNLPENLLPRVANTAILSITSGPIPVTPGDYFETVCQLSGDTSVNLLANRSWFSIEQLEG